MLVFSSLPLIVSLFLPLFVSLAHFPSSVLSPSQPSSCSPSPALSTESLSSGSEQRSGGGASSDQEHSFTKSSSEPSICTPCNTSSSNERLTQASLSPCPPYTPLNASSAPATPQASRSAGTNESLAPSQETTPSPLASDTSHRLNKVILSTPNRAVFIEMCTIYLKCICFLLCSGSARRTPLIGKHLPPQPNPKASHQKALDLPDHQHLAMAFHLSNAK